MPSKCRGQYDRVAVMLMEEGAPAPTMISDRARGCLKIVRVWEKCYSGGERSASQRAQRDAKALADQINSGEIHV